MKRYIALMFMAALLLTSCGNANDVPPSDRPTENAPQKITNVTSVKTVSLEIKNDDTAENGAKNKEENIFGLRDVREEENGGCKTIAFTFLRLKGGDVNSSILSESDSISGLTPYGPFEFDKSEVADNGDTFDVVLTYDSRITLAEITFERGDERCIIKLKDDLKLIYCDFSDIKLTKRKYQSFNAEKDSWDESYDQEEENDLRETVEPRVVTYKDIYHDAETGYPVNTFGDVRFQATKYRYSGEAYNIYGEVSRPALTTLRFDLINKKEPVNAEISESDIKLYKKTGGEYTDITPGDISVSLNSYNDGSNLTINVESSTLGDLDEGDYKAECGEYYVDFTLAMQNDEIW